MGNQDKPTGCDKRPLRLYIATYGCQMNSRDSEALLGLFLDKGYVQAKSEKEADVILINTCSVREHAEHRVDSLLGHLKKRVNSAQRIAVSSKNKQNQRKDLLHANRYTLIAQPIIGLIGCMAKNKGEEIFAKWPHVDLIVAPAHLHKIPEYVEKIKVARHQSPVTCHEEKDTKKNAIRNTQYAQRLRIIDVEDGERKEEFYRAEYREKKNHAQVVISTGCSNHCSYCVVPHVRGELRLRSPQDIIAEVKRNVELGRTKITLLGQNVNDYCFRLQAPGYRLQEKTKENTNRYTLTVIRFIDLLRMVDEIEGVTEIEFLTPHPKNTNKELFKLMAKSKKIRKYLHLPYQSGSDRILKLMHRGYTKKDYLSLVEDYKAIVGGTIGTDIIVGFPGETDKDFAHTKDVLERVRFMGAYIFKYSPRPNTRAAKLSDDVPAAVKEKRHKILLDLQRKISSGK